MALVEIKFAPWSMKSSLQVEVGDEVNPIFRLRSALEIVVGEIKEGKRESAVLSGADLSGAVLREILEKEVPLIPNIDAAILASIEKNKAAGTNGLDMGSWHGKEDIDETNWCGTTHCRAGYAICLAGKEGFALEKKYGSATAGMLLYMKSTPDAKIPNFYTTDERAMADLRERAAKQTSPSGA